LILRRRSARKHMPVHQACAHHLTEVVACADVRVVHAEKRIGAEERPPHGKFKALSLGVNPVLNHLDVAALVPVLLPEMVDVDLFLGSGPLLSLGLPSLLSLLCL